jgi:hypothetical protein
VPHATIRTFQHHAIENNTGEDDRGHRRCDSYNRHTLGSRGHRTCWIDSRRIGRYCHNPSAQGFVVEIWTPVRACCAQASDRCDYCVPGPATHAGQFVPGLTALDTSAQILAWALLFGYAQQVFTRLADRQGQNVLNSVRGANRPQTNTTQP